MPTTRAILTQAEYESLRSHLKKHKIYPYSYAIRKAISAANFTLTDGASVVKYFTYTFTPPEATGIVSLATNLVITPETTFGLLGLQLSYKSTLSLADNVSAVKPNDEGTEAYNIMVNGGAINDFQVFFPLNYYVESRQPIYIHVYADSTTVSAGTSTLTGRIILGAMPLTN